MCIWTATTRLRTGLYNTYMPFQNPILNTDFITGAGATDTKPVHAYKDHI